MFAASRESLKRNRFRSAVSALPLTSVTHPRLSALSGQIDGQPGDSPTTSSQTPPEPARAGSTTPVISTPPPEESPLPLAGPVGMLSEPEGLRTLEYELALAARRTWPALPGADIAAAVDAAMLAAATETANAAVHAARDAGRGLFGGFGEVALATAGETGAAAAAVQRQGLLPGATEPVDWSRFGTVITVLAGSPGAGASVLTAVLADALQLEQRRVLMVDLADPPRSGLGAAARSDGPWVTQAHPQVHVRFSWRAQALLARLETALPVIAPGMVPPPPLWQPIGVPQPQVTVADLGHDPWRVAAHPLVGAGAWLRRGTPSPRPLLVVRASRPSLLHAEQILARLDPWVAVAAVSAPAQLVVMGAKRWPSGVFGAAGRRVAALLPDAVFVPHDSDLAAAGVTAAVTPARLRQAVTPLLRAWGLLPDTNGQRTRTKGRS